MTSRPSLRRRLGAEFVGSLLLATIVAGSGGDTCPYIPGRRYEDWPIADPAETDADGVEAIRDDINTRVRQLLDSIFPGLALPELTHPKS